MFLLPLSYSYQAELLSRFLDVSFPEPEFSPTAPASTASTTAADAPLQAELEPTEYPDSIPLVETQAADVLDPLLLGPGTAASEPRKAGAAAKPYSARAIDHRVDAAYLSTGNDNGTTSERDRSSGMEESPRTLTPQPSSRLKLELLDLGRLELEGSGLGMDWSALKSINRISRNNSAASPTSNDKLCCRL